MKKLLLGYVVATLLGLFLIVVLDNGLVDGGSGVLPSGAGILSMFLLPEMFPIRSLTTTAKLHAFRSDMIPPFLFVMSTKMVLGYGIASFILFLWNRK